MNFTQNAALLCVVVLSAFASAEQTYTIVDTGQIRCYSNNLEIEYPSVGGRFYGQDAQYNGNQPSYRNNGDGTVTDLNTGLMWTRQPQAKMTHSQAAAHALACTVGGYTDWRLPTIKELYSLILFSGTDPDPQSVDTSKQRPFIDTRYFGFQYGNPADGERIIDSQFATCTIYRSTTMNGSKTMFGVNFADGRIKGYPIGAGRGPRGEKTYCVLFVRGNTEYGKNRFVDNGDGTITDRATGLMWQKADSSRGLNWSQALKYAEGLDDAGYSDWRLPNAKELQSIVDYTRCPDATDSAAIDPVFEVTAIKNEGGQTDYPFYWTSTSHVNLSHGASGVYIAFGRALGFMSAPGSDEKQLMDVHGAGAQRSDPKTGSASQFPTGRGPQGDVIRIQNYVRCVRSGVAQPRTSGPALELTKISQGSRPDNMPTRQGTSQGRLSRQQGPSAADFINRLDTNGDGKVSRSEFDGPAEHFSHLDRNGDGYISKDEASRLPSPRQQR